MDLRRFLTSFFEFRPIFQNTLTIVNVEPDEQSLEVGEQAQEELGVRHISFPTNVGYAMACNTGGLGDLENIAFFNADIVLTEQAIDQCSLALAVNSRWGVLGPRQVDTKGRFTHAGIFGTQHKPKIRDWHRYDRGQHTDIEPAVTVSGSAYFVKRDCWDELTTCTRFQRSCAELGVKSPDGGFLPTPHYYEETWCSYHAFAHDWDVLYYGPVTLIHEWHQASPSGGWADKQMPKSRAMFRKACDDHGISHD